jgi:hypothetical protein
MLEPSSVTDGVRLRVSRRSVIVIGSDFELGSGGRIVVPLSVFFPSQVAVLRMTRIDPDAFQSKRITSLIIPRYVQFLCSSWSSACQSLSSISFETDSELTRIKSNTLYFCHSLESITIPRRVQIVCSECFSHCKPLSSISFETDSELTGIESRAFYYISLELITIPSHVHIPGCSTSGVAQRAMRETVPHACGVSKARQF